MTDDRCQITYYFDYFDNIVFIAESQRESQRVAKDRNSNNIRVRRGSIGGHTDDLSYQFKPSLPSPSEW